MTRAGGSEKKAVVQEIFPWTSISSIRRGKIKGVTRTILIAQMLWYAGTFFVQRSEECADCKANRIVSLTIVMGVGKAVANGKLTKQESRRHRNFTRSASKTFPKALWTMLGRKSRSNVQNLCDERTRYTVCGGLGPSISISPESYEEDQER